MIGVLAIILAELLDGQFRRALGDAHAGPVVPALALATLKPDIFSFALLFRHKDSPQPVTPARSPAHNARIGPRTDPPGRCVR